MSVGDNQALVDAGLYLTEAAAINLAPIEKRQQDLIERAVLAEREQIASSADRYALITGEQALFAFAAAIRKGDA